MRPATSTVDATTSRMALRAVQTVAVICALLAACLAIRYAAQKPLDRYSFRQTQTALTAYWLGRNGPSFAYETPVLGEPWSVPFELPVYQAVVAAVSRIPGTDLDVAGRLVGFGFLLACVPQVLAITRRLRSSPLVFPIFCVLLFSSPTYVYWGRSFMIETTALFFCVAAVRRFVDLCFDPDSRRSAWLLLFFLSLGMLQKITTALPVALVLGPAFVIVRSHVRRDAGLHRMKRDELVTAAVCFGVPLVLGALWTLYTDGIKDLNVFGRQLTSSELRSWNIGPLSQRFEAPLYEHVFWRRIVEHNLGGLFGLLMIAAALTLTRIERTAWTLRISLLLGLLPVFLFANLHLSHDYYTCGNLVYLHFALAFALGELLARRMRPWVLLIALGFVAVDDYAVVASDALPDMRVVYTDAHDTEMAIATVIQAHVPPDRIFAAFDFDWSSSLAYLSERKAFMFSRLFRQVDSARTDPTRFVDAGTLGAVVACPKDEPHLRQLVDWSVHGRRWKIGLVDDCYVAVPEQAAPVRSVGPSTTCEATAIDVLPVRESPAMRVVRLRLRGGAAPASYATGASPTDLHEMLDVTRRSLRPGIDRGDVPDAEFTRLIDVGASGDAAIHVYRRTNDGLDACRVVEASRAP